MSPFVELAQHLVTGGRESFLATDIAQVLTREGPDNLISMLGLFDKPHRATIARLIHAIATDAPGITKAEVQRISIPVLVIGNTLDFVHPLSHAQTLADLIPQARFVEVISKAKDKTRHSAACRFAIESFLKDI